MTENNEKQAGLSWINGGFMIGLAGLFDGIIISSMFITFGFAVIFTWLIGLFAFLSFNMWLAIKGELNFKRAILLTAPFWSSIFGVPGWTATIWPLVAKIIGAKALSKVAPESAQKVLKKVA